jgi:hypothetical protein
MSLSYCPFRCQGCTKGFCRFKSPLKLAMEYGLKRRSMCQDTLHITTTVHRVTSPATVIFLLSVCMRIWKARCSPLVNLNPNNLKTWPNLIGIVHSGKENCNVIGRGVQCLNHVGIIRSLSNRIRRYVSNAGL